MADSRYGSVYLSLLTLNSMLTSRPTQISALVLHLLKIYFLPDQTMTVIAFLTMISVFQFTNAFPSYQLSYKTATLEINKSISSILLLFDFLLLLLLLVLLLLSSSLRYVSYYNHLY